MKLHIFQIINLTQTTGGRLKRANWFPRNKEEMKLENIKVAARLRESPAAFFKINKLTLSEDEKSIFISSLNGELKKI